jgi:hypothetical protein
MDLHAKRRAMNGQACAHTLDQSHRLFDLLEYQHSCVRSL